MGLSYAFLPSFLPKPKSNISVQYLSLMWTSTFVFPYRFLVPPPTVDATCHNNSISPWTQCSETCGIGLSTRETKTVHGCQKLGSLRLCQNRQCAITIDSANDNRNRGRMKEHQDELMMPHKTRVNFKIYIYIYVYIHNLIRNLWQRCVCVYIYLKFNIFIYRTDTTVGICFE